MRSVFATDFGGRRKATLQTTLCTPVTTGVPLGSFLLQYVSMETQKFALVTGGSEGVGFAIAEMLVGNGFHVILVARNVEKLESARAVLGDTHVSLLSCDVTNQQSVEQLYVSVLEITSHIDVLVNSAGTFKWDNSGVDLMQLNAVSKELVTKTFVKYLSDGALVVNVSSQAALFAEDDVRCVDEHEYIASMQRVDTFTEEFALEHPEFRVYVTHPPLMKGKIANEQFRGRPGFEGIDFDSLPGPEIVAQELEQKFFVNN